MLDNARLNALQDTLRNDPTERDRFVADPAGYLETMGVSVPQAPVRKDAVCGAKGPPIPGILLLG